MNASVRTMAFAACAWSAFACDTAEKERIATVTTATAAARASRLTAALATADVAVAADAPLAEWVLPPALQEISGLALTSDGRMLAHDDEVGTVWEIDYRRGVLVKQFSLGSERLRHDFEAITIAHDKIYLMASNGNLFTFTEGAAGTRVEYKTIKTGLGAACEFEGIAFDAVNDALLMACKDVHDQAAKGMLIIYRWSLRSKTDAPFTRLEIPLGDVLRANGWKNLHPSDICVDPLTGNYVLVASIENALISVTPAGAIVFARPLPARHHQAEGIAITTDGILIVSDEGAGAPAAITLYKWPSMWNEKHDSVTVVKSKGTQ